MAGKGSPKGVKQGGRAPGTPNKQTRELKAMIEGALQKAGGEAYLLRQAEDNPTAFLNLVSKLIPKDINAKVAGDMILKVVTGVPSADQ